MGKAPGCDRREISRGNWSERTERRLTVAGEDEGGQSGDTHVEGSRSQVLVPRDQGYDSACVGEGESQFPSRVERADEGWGG